MRDGKDQAYWERNQLVLYLSRMFPSWLELHPVSDTDWEDDWRNIVCIEFPEGRYTWHIHDSEYHKYFRHLTYENGSCWDGSTTEEKYAVLRGCK